MAQRHKDKDDLMRQREMGPVATKDIVMEFEFTKTKLAARRGLPNFYDPYVEVAPSHAGKTTRMVQEIVAWVQQGNIAIVQSHERSSSYLRSRLAHELDKVGWDKELTDTMRRGQWGQRAHFGGICFTSGREQFSRERVYDYYRGRTTEKLVKVRVFADNIDLIPHNELIIDFGGYYNCTDWNAVDKETRDKLMYASGGEATFVTVKEELPRDDMKLLREVLKSAHRQTFVEGCPECEEESTEDVGSVTYYKIKQDKVPQLVKEVADGIAYYTREDLNRQFHLWHFHRARYQRLRNASYAVNLETNEVLKSPESAEEILDRYIAYRQGLISVKK